MSIQICDFPKWKYNSRFFKMFDQSFIVYCINNHHISIIIWDLYSFYIATLDVCFVGEYFKNASNNNQS